MRDVYTMTAVGDEGSLTFTTTLLEDAIDIARTVMHGRLGAFDYVAVWMEGRNMPVRIWTFEGGDWRRLAGEEVPVDILRRAPHIGDAKEPNA